MTFLPIVARELRVTARRGSTYWLRLASALLALAAGAWIYVVSYRDSPSSLGQAMFITLTIVANLYALLAGMRVTADCLSEEKREGTLGLLFLTDLKGYDIVLGKLAATSLNAFYWLLAVFPMLGISLIMGGVTPGEFARVIAVSVNNLLFSLAVGMFCSSVSRDDRKAAGGTFLVILFLTAGLPLLGMWMETLTRNGHAWPLFSVPNPAFTCYAAFDQMYTRSGYGGVFYLSALVVLGMSWALLALACWIVPRTWQEKESSGGGGGLRGRWRQWQFGSAEQRLARRRMLLAVNPVLWLTNRERFKLALVWTILAALGLAWLWGHVAWGRYWDEVAGLLGAFAAHTVLKVWLAGEAGRRLAEDRRSGALELLLATPIGVEEILQGQRLALWRQCAWPTVAVLVMDCILVVVGLDIFHGSEERVWMLVWGIGGAMLVWDLFTLSWVGMWMGLNSRTPNRASSAAWVRVCVLPWLAFAALMTLLAVMEEVSRSSSLIKPEGAAVAWFLIGGANNLLFAGWAKARLRSRFRETATERFEGRPPGFWARLIAGGKR